MFASSWVFSYTGGNSSFKWKKIFPKMAVRDSFSCEAAISLKSRQVKSAWKTKEVVDNCIPHQ